MVHRDHEVRFSASFGTKHSPKANLGGSSPVRAPEPQVRTSPPVPQESERFASLRRLGYPSRTRTESRSRLRVVRGANESPEASARGRGVLSVCASGRARRWLAKPWTACKSARRRGSARALRTRGKREPTGAHVSTSANRRPTLSSRSLGGTPCEQQRSHSSRRFSGSPRRMPSPKRGEFAASAACRGWVACRSRGWRI
jgi:hypothetical protein